MMMMMSRNMMERQRLSLSKEDMSRRIASNQQQQQSRAGRLTRLSNCFHVDIFARYFDILSNSQCVYKVFSDIEFL